MSDILDKIIEAKEKMGDNAIERIVKHYNLENYNPERKSASCPFHTDKTPSLIWNNKDKAFKCFSCSRRISILDMYIDTEGSYSKAVKRLCNETGVNIDTKSIERNKDDYFVNYKYPKPEQNKTRDIVDQYCAKRGISKETLNYMGVKQDPHGNVTFEFHDLDGELVCKKYRLSKTPKNGMPKMWWDKDSDKCPVLYNIDKVDITKPVVITEGMCFPGSAEVLTPNGWIKLENYNDELVMQVNKDLSCQFVMPYAKIKHRFDGQLKRIEIGGNYLSETTPDHSIVYFNKPNELKKRRVDTLPDTFGNIPTSANYIGGTGINFTDAEIRLQVAFSADGSFNKSGCYRKNGKSRIRFAFAKERKFLRLKEILNECEINYTETIKSSDKYKSGKLYYIGFEDKEHFLTKEFNMSWISEMTRHQIDVLLEEVVYWDGGKFKYKNQAEFYSGNKNNIDFIQTLCHISGFMSTIKHRKGNYKLCTVSMLYGKDHVSGQNMYKYKRIKDVEYHGDVYCVSVSSGMILVRQEEKICVTGNCDTLSVFESGYTNVVSIPGGAEDSNWIDFNYEFLENIENFILWFDNDKAGQDGLKKVVSRLGEYRCKIVKPSKEDEDAVEKYYKTFNESLSVRKTDANNILLALGKDRVLSLINSAEEIPNKKLKYLMDCADKNIAEQEKFSFGINEMDKILYGNLFSCFTIYSGKSGGGKSSLTNTTALISPVEHGYKVFSFSGELSDGQLADWVVNCLAGYNHVRKIPGVIKDGSPYYVTTKEAEDAIRKYYKRDMILYSDEDALDVSGDNLLMAMEDAYKRHGCRVFNIDNLMCLDFEQTDDDKWTSQKKFIIKLMGFAKKYDVCVNLVLHPKKMARDQKEVSTFDLHGASEIGNLCHRMIWVERLEDDEQGYNTKITIVKDRPTGKAGKSCKLYYDDKTRRFYSTNDELRKTYRWEKDFKIKYPPDIEKDLIKNDPVNSLPNEPCNYDPDSPF